MMWVLQRADRSSALFATGHPGRIHRVAPRRSVRTRFGEYEPHMVEGELVPTESALYTINTQEKYGAWV